MLFWFQTWAPLGLLTVFFIPPHSQPLLTVLSFFKKFWSPPLPLHGQHHGQGLTPRSSLGCSTARCEHQVHLYTRKPCQALGTGSPQRSQFMTAFQGRLMEDPVSVWSFPTLTSPAVPGLPTSCAQASLCPHMLCQPLSPCSVASPHAMGSLLCLVHQCPHQGDLKPLPRPE